MAVQEKTRRGSEFAQKAANLRSDLLDPEKDFTKDELLKLQEQISVFEQRAQAAAGFTPDEEIDDQGGDKHARRHAPEGSGTRTPSDADENGVSRRRQSAFVARQAELRENINEAFGGMDSFILAMSYRGKEPLTTPQQRVLQELEKFQKRTIVGTSGDASKAEVLLPLEQVEQIFMVDNTVDGIASQARRYVMSGRTLRIPHVKQTNGANTRPMAGIANVSYHTEAQEKEQREVTFDQRVMEAYKVAAYSELGDEILVDDMTGQLQSSVSGLVGGQILNFINEQATFDGRGEAQDELLGAFNPANPALYKVVRKTQNRFKYEDAVEMLARHILGPKSRWYMSSSVLPDLLQLAIGTTTLVTFVTDMKGKPGMQLFGIPIVFTDIMPTIGQQADVALGNADFYAYALRTALTIESSRDYKFRADVTALRMFARAAGLSIPDGTYSYKAVASVKSYEKSPFVVLDDVYAA
ncbi:MAG: phage major capsid protein [Gemmatimonadota bacterium]